MPGKSHLVALFARRTAKQAHHILGMMMWRVGRWISEHGFSLALEKTKVVVLTKGRVPTVQVGEIMVFSKPAIKYIVIMKAGSEHPAIQSVLFYRCEVTVASKIQSEELPNFICLSYHLDIRSNCDSRSYSERCSHYRAKVYIPQKKKRK